MREVFIVSTARTPMGRFGGVFRDVSPVQLGSTVMAAALERAGLSGAKLDLLVFGNVLRAGFGQLLPRQAALAAGIPDTVDGYAVDMVCSSAMMSVLNAVHMIQTGNADLVLAGGFESMTQAGFVLSHRARWGYRSLLGSPEALTDVMLYDGLTDPTTGEAMGAQTERLAREYGVTRAALDQVAAQSHERAARATADGIFAREIVPLEVKSKSGTDRVKTDEGIRADTTVEVLAKLRPTFAKDGLLTAGNSSQVSDGAAAVVLAAADALEPNGLSPKAKIVGGAWSAGPTWRFAEAPVPAVRKLLDKVGWQIKDVDRFENNEAFALSSIVFAQQLQVSHERLNVHGGAIALGHPIGATGARLIVSLIGALEECNGKRGIAALCHGTGGGTAVAIERA